MSCDKDDRWYLVHWRSFIAQLNIDAASKSIWAEGLGLRFPSQRADFFQAEQFAEQFIFRPDLTFFVIQPVNSPADCSRS